MIFVLFTVTSLTVAIAFNCGGTSNNSITIRVLAQWENEFPCEGNQKRSEKSSTSKQELSTCAVRVILLNYLANQNNQNKRFPSPNSIFMKFDKFLIIQPLISRKLPISVIIFCHRVWKYFNSPTNLF